MAFDILFCELSWIYRLFPIFFKGDTSLDIAELRGDYELTRILRSSEAVGEAENEPVSVSLLIKR